MIKIIKILIALVMVCQLFSCGLVAKNGLVKEGENTYYYLNDKKQTGWQEIDGDWYYFLNEVMMQGFLVDADGKEYFFDYNDGKMVKNKFIKIEESEVRYTIDNNQNIRALEFNGKTIEYSVGETKEVNTGPGGRKEILDESGKILKEEPGNFYRGLAYFGEDGARLYNTQKEWGGKIYIIDENGIAKQQPDYQLVFDSSFPITIYSYEDAVIIEKIDYELYELKELPGSSYRRGGQVFETYWTGIAGNSYKGSNYSTPRYVGYKLYDPNGYVIETGSFSTGVALAMGERFKDKHMRLSSNITKKGIYKLKLLGESK